MQNELTAERIERAIALIEEDEVMKCACKKCANDRWAFETALAALREQAEREKGCEYCDDNFKFWQAQISGELPNVRFCPMCGKRLEVKQ